MFGGRYFGARHFGERFFGKAGLVVDGAYHGSRYLGRRYFGQRYFSSSSVNVPFAITSTNTPALSGVIGVSGTLAFGRDFEVTQTTGISLSGSTALNGGALAFESEVFYFTPPIAVSELAGAVSVAGDFTITYPAPGYGGYFARRFFGGRHYGARYFGSPVSHSVTVSASPSLAGVLQVAGNIGVGVDVAPSTLGISGSLTVAGDIEIAARNLGGFMQRTAVGPKKRNYIVQGQKFYDLTTEELAQVVAQMGRVKRKDIKVEMADQKPKTVDSTTWQEVKPFDDDEDVLLLL